MYKGKIKIDGRNYWFYGWKKTKKEARKYADYIRLRGNLVRILVRHPDGKKRYAIYGSEIRRK